MNLIGKIIGIIICIVGLGIWYIDYIVFTAIGALVAWIAEAIGITGPAVLGLQVVGWILTLGTMVLLFFCGLVVFWSGFMIVMGYK